MPQTPDEPPSDRIGGDAPNPVPAENETLARPRRRRRRRRRPLGEAGPTQATAAGQNQSHAPPSSETPAGPPGDAGPRRHRRRHRGTRREAATAVDVSAAQSAPDTASSPVEPEPKAAGNGAPRGISTSDSEPHGPDRPIRPSRRRRRRPPPAATSAGEAGAELPAAEVMFADHETPQGGAPPSPPAGDKEPRGPRHPHSRGRRRRPMRSLDATARGERQVKGGSPSQDTSRTPDRGSPSPEPRNRRANAERPPQRGRDDRERGPRDRRPPGRNAPGRFERQRGRDRAAPQKLAEPRLYGLESVVDRGFEDVADTGDVDATRRVYWTILKRTVADQHTGKPISATYVLQRDGIDTEFSNLGTARAAANKTIVHPEKLTLSKAEHAAAKK
jgi:hypothetical protein